MGTQKSKCQIAEGISYFGQVQQDKPHGQGELLINQELSTLKFTGKFFEGLPIQGTATVNDLQYSGQTSNCAFSGQGILRDKLGSIYKGTFEDGHLKKGDIVHRNQFKSNGQYDQTYQIQGESSFQDLTTGQYLNGNFLNGNIQGEGEYTFENKDNYKGTFHDGQMNGKGCYKSVNSHFKFSGKFSKSIPQQYGEIKFSSGETYKGQIKEGHMHGNGDYKFVDGTLYKGSFYYDSMTGDCQILYPQGSQVQVYQGEISNGCFSGLGVVQYSNGAIYKGYFYQNLKNGPGIIIYGKRILKCLFIMNRLIGKLEEIQVRQ